MNVVERFFDYIGRDTASDENNPACPSTEGQRAFGAALVQQMQEIGIEDARMDEHAYVYGSIPGNTDGPCIGLIAHMDTVHDAPVLPMNARIVKAYDGCDVALNDAGDVLSVAQFPDLVKYKGQDLIVTDGKTILGADDKAGIAEILTACERLIGDPSIKHAKIAIAFTPDEEIGRGADLFDVKGFGAEYAYTVDGGEVGGIEYENFNAASGKLVVHGVNIHPGSAKHKMKSAMLIANEFIGLLPATETPATTEGYEGFFHLVHMQGEVEQAQLDYIIRDHDKTKFEARKQLFLDAAAFLNRKYGEGTCEASVQDSYLNMREMLEDKLHIVARAEEAMRTCGVEPYTEPIRGGTDGSRLSFMGLPCPNISTGGMNAHGRHECISVQSMEKMVDVLVALMRA
ncbi:peptidase T [Eubacteriales bacterium OttesenSCG-928-N13]|nr:peptidase T [Eubacteriales bacterium OttesenSCG-928-N13]